MTVQTKLGIIIPVTLVMGIGFFMMMRANVLVPSIILAIVWVCHIIYLCLGQEQSPKSKKRKFNDFHMRNIKRICGGKSDVYAFPFT